MKYDEQTMNDVMNLMFDNISWPIWKEKIERILEKKEAEHERKRLQSRESHQMFEFLTTRSVKNRRDYIPDINVDVFNEIKKCNTSVEMHDILDGYWVGHEKDFVDHVLNYEEIYDINITIRETLREEQPEKFTGGLMFDVENFRIIPNELRHEIEEKKKKGINIGRIDPNIYVPAVIDLPAQSAVLYATILELGKINVDAIRNYYENKSLDKILEESSDKMPEEVKTAIKYYKIAKFNYQIAKGNNFLTRDEYDKQAKKDVKTILYDNFDSKCSSTNNYINRIFSVDITDDDADSKIKYKVIEKLKISQLNREERIKTIDVLRSHVKIKAKPDKSLI